MRTLGTARPRAIPRWLGIGLAGALALTVPTWLDQADPHEPRFEPIADLFERAEPGRVEPDAVEQSLRQRLDTTDADADLAPSEASPMLRHGGSAIPPPALPDLPALPRAFDPNTPLGH